MPSWCSIITSLSKFTVLFISIHLLEIKVLMKHIPHTEMMVEVNESVQVLHLAVLYALHVLDLQTHRANAEATDYRKFPHLLDAT